jgi:PAS domain S-box-containing protein
MGNTHGLVRLASNATRPLTDDIFDALRDAVLVVDTHTKHFPLVLANAAARRCLVGDSRVIPLSEFSLHALLGPATEAVIAAALRAAGEGKAGYSRMVTWRFPRGDIPRYTEAKVLEMDPAHPLVMLTFAEPAAEPGAGLAAEHGVMSAVEQLPLDLLILDNELKVTYANAGAARTAGSSPESLLGLSAMIVAPTSAVPREALTDALAGLPFHDHSVAMTVPGESTRYFDVDVQPLTDEAAVVGLAVLSMEMTERRRRRRPTGGGDLRMFTLTEHARDIISVASPEGQILYVSGGISNVLGYAPEERLSQSAFDLVHPDDLEGFKAQYADVAAGRLRGFSQQFRVRHKDGAHRWLDCNIVSALDNPLVKGVVVNALDVTERKQVEMRLAQREEVFNLAADSVNGIIFEWDLSEGVVRRSRGVHDVLGLEPKDLESVSAWAERIHPQDREPYEHQVAQALASGRGWTAGYRIRNTGGRYRSVLERGLIQRNMADQPIRAIGCVVDVSEIKRLTDVLAEAQRVAKMGCWEYHYATRELEWSEEMFRLYETAPAEFAVSWRAMLGQCPPESRARLGEAIERAESGDGQLDLELEILTLKQQRIWVRLVGHIERHAGRPFRAFGSVQNVQSQKLAQIALENGTAWLKLSMDMAQMHAWRWNRAADTLEFAVRDGPLMNLPRVFPGMKKLMSRVHPKDRVGVRRAIDVAFERHTEVRVEFRLKSHDGGYRAYAAVARPQFDASNQPSGLVGVTQDVTSDREAQARLRRSEELLRTTTANTAETLLLVDQELRIRFINRETGGRAGEDLVGQPLAVLLPPGAREAVNDKLHHVLWTGETATYEFEATSADGGIEYFENRAVRVRDDNSLSITMRNITERKRLEREILEVSSRERHAIGRDLHDGLGQELTGVALMMKGLAARLATRDPECREQVEEIARGVQQSIETAHSLARGLLPVHTDHGGLEGAVRALAERGRELYGLEVHCRIKVSPERRLSEATANHLYRIAQEALTNAARHARAQSLNIYLLVTPSKLVLRITDDGVGMQASEPSGAGMGLKIMQYRASMIGATFEIMPHHPHGSVICVTGQQSSATSTVKSASAV